MGLERRGNKFYYYKKIRSNGKVKSVYYGSGEFAESLAQLDELDKIVEKRDKIDKKKLLEETLTELKTLTQDLDSHCELINSLIEAILLITSHHNHKGEWRKQRVNNKPRSQQRSS